VTASTLEFFETRFPIANTSRDFPFGCELSLAALISIWKNTAHNGRPIAALFHRRVLQQIAKAPELLNPIDDLPVLHRHRELVDVLMMEVFPPASWNNDYEAAMEALNAHRITMTSAVLNNAACVIFLVSGAQKAGMLYTVLHGEYQPDQYPAQIARPVGENCRGS
jgi:hypothetical protein